MGLSYADLAMAGIEIHPDVEDLSRAGGRALTISALPPVDEAMSDDYAGHFVNVDGKPVMFPEVVTITPMTDEVRKGLDDYFSVDRLDDFPWLTGDGINPTGWYGRRYEAEYRVFRPWCIQPLGDGAGGMAIAEAICDASRRRIDDTPYDLYYNFLHLERESYEYGELEVSTIPDDLGDIEQDTDEYMYFSTLFECVKQGLIVIDKTDERWGWSEAGAVEISFAPMSDYLRDPQALEVWEQLERRSKIASRNATRTIPKPQRNAYFWNERLIDPWV